MARTPTRMPIRRGEVPDIRTVQNRQFPKYSVTIDWQLLEDGTLDDKQALASAIVIALGTDALADPEDILPDPDSTDRRGWWGNHEAELIWNAWPVGSKLWLLRRSAIQGPNFRTGATIAQVKAYIIQAIQPFVDHRVCSRFDVWCERAHDERIDAFIRIYRGPLPAIDMRYALLWDEQTHAVEDESPLGMRTPEDY